ncbi:MAG: bifunctional phosphoserine phosphatase/homoserine phosphotransferase ThrH [Verrucomicrobiota bacterium]|nr:bifunctional phosphoserine phosphatase/homoserine phosphotransferase ThrH [Verrucomicrobiota bacterium]
MIALDLEGVLVPEVWITFAEKTGIKDLSLTTRDINDYDKLMKYRLNILEKEKLSLKDIQDVIKTINPIPGAKKFINWLRQNFQVVILSDTFYEFAQPLMKQLNYPMLLCHSLITDPKEMITDYKIRIPDGKRKAVINFKNLGFNLLAAGDSYNDTHMLAEANKGVLFKAPKNIIAEFSQFETCHEYGELEKIILTYYLDPA